MQTETILTGQVLSFTGSPFGQNPTDAARFDEAVGIGGGQITALGTLDALRTAAPEARVENYGDKIIMAGFVQL